MILKLRVTWTFGEDVESAGPPPPPPGTDYLAWAPAMGADEDLAWLDDSGVAQPLVWSL